MTEKSEKTVTRTVKVGMFPYRARVTGPDGNEQIVMKRAERGETIELFDPADITRGDNNDHFLKDGESLTPQPSAKSLDEIGLMTDDELDDLFRNARPKVDDLLHVIGNDPELAARVLTVENDTTDDPRKSLVEALEKITGAGD